MGAAVHVKVLFSLALLFLLHVLILVRFSRVSFGFLWFGDVQRSFEALSEDLSKFRRETQKLEEVDEELQRGQMDSRVVITCVPNI